MLFSAEGEAAQISEIKSVVAQYLNFRRRLGFDNWTQNFDKIVLQKPADFGDM